MKLPPPFQITQHPVPRDTIEALEQLLDEAKRGRIIGMAFVTMYKRREFATIATGEAYRNPVFARGMVAALDDHLKEMMHG